MRRPSRTAAIVVGLTGAVAMGAGLLPTAATADAGHDQGSTIQLREHQTSSTFLSGGKPVTNPNQLPKAGDTLVFISTLSRGGKVVGHDAVQCTAASPSQLVCVGGFILPAGQITGSGVVPANAPSFTVPITGGTGHYRAVGGQLQIRSVSDTDSILTFQLLGVR